jgi:hypothetical protein
MIGSGSIRNPFFITAEPSLNSTAKYSNRNTDGKTLVNPSVYEGKKVLCLIATGQSNIANSGQVSYTTLNPSKVHNLNIWDGAVYQGQDPFVGTSISPTGPGSWLGRMGDAIIADGYYDFVVFVTIAMGGSAIIEHVPGGAENSKYLCAVERCRALGLTINAFLWMQGESDNGVTSQANYLSRLQQVIATPRSIGENAPWFVGKCTYINDVIDNNIRTAQAGVVNNVDIFAGADTDTVTGATNRYAGLVHLTATGAAAVAALWKTAITPILQLPSPV